MIAILSLGAEKHGRIYKEQKKFFKNPTIWRGNGF